MEQTTNVRLILDKLLRHPLMLDLSFETAVDYTVDFLRIIGCPTMYEEKVATIDIKDYRAMLPCDFHEVITVRDTKTLLAYIYASNEFHMGSTKFIDGELTYKIQGNIIYTSTKEGLIDMAYRAIAVDDEGYPLLPDNSSFTRALQAYIKKEWFTIMFDMGKIQPAVLLNVQLEYAWAVGDCQTEFNRLSLDKAQSLANAWSLLVLRTKQHLSGFRFDNLKQIIKQH